MEKKNNSNIIFITAIAGLLLTRIIGAWIIPVYDDAFITFRYAENLANGFGLVYNPGEYVLGLTTPLFGIISGIFAFLGFRLPDAIIGMNILLDSVTLLIIYRIFTKKDLMLEFILFSFLYSISPIATRVTVGGMEMNLFLLLSVLTIYYYTKNKKFISVTVGTVAYFVRPEGAILVILLVVYEFFKGEKLKSIKIALVSLLILILPFYLLFHFYGSIIPQSVISKTGGIHNNFFSIFKGFFAEDIICIFSIPFAVFGFYKFLKKDEFLKIIGLWSLFYFLIYLAARPHVWSWYPHTFRFAMFVFAAFSLADLFRKFTGVRRRINLVIMNHTLFFFLGLVWIFLLISFGRSPVTVNVYKPIENWFKQENFIGKKILANDIGVIGFYSNAYIFDSDGLVSPDALKFGKFDEMIINIHPDYLFLVVSKVNLKIMKRKELAANYLPIKRFAKSGKTDLLIDPESVKESWSQDYLLYKRIGK